MVHEKYLLDLVPVPLWGMDIIVCKDYISLNEDLIDREHQLVWIQTLSRGELVTHGESAQYGPTICSAARARRYVQQGYSRFSVYIMDILAVGKKTVDGVPIFWEHHDVFPKDFSGVLIGLYL